MTASSANLRPRPRPLLSCPLRRRAALRPLSGQLGRHRREHTASSTHPRCCSPHPRRDDSKGQNRPKPRSKRSGLMLHRTMHTRPAEPYPARRTQWQSPQIRDRWTRDCSLPFGSRRDALVSIPGIPGSRSRIILYVLRPPHRRMLFLRDANGKEFHVGNECIKKAVTPDCTTPSRRNSGA